MVQVTRERDPGRGTARPQLGARRVQQLAAGASVNCNLAQHHSTAATREHERTIMHARRQPPRACTPPLPSHHCSHQPRLARALFTRASAAFWGRSVRAFLCARALWAHLCSSPWQAALTSAALMPGGDHGQQLGPEY